MLEVQVDARVVDTLLGTFVPGAAAALGGLGLTAELWCIGWLMCGFVNSAPLETALRVWDWMLLEGSAALVRAAVAVVALAEAEVVAAAAASGASGALAALAAAGRGVTDVAALLEAAAGFDRRQRFDLDHLRAQARGPRTPYPCALRSVELSPPWWYIF